VPIIPSFAYFPARYVAGVTCEDAFFNLPKWHAACKKVALDYEPDLYNFALTQPGQVQLALGNSQLLLPGHGVSSMHSHQFVEGEYMRADEWDEYLHNPTDFLIRTYLPRVYGKLRAFSELPPLGRLFWGYSEAVATELFTHQNFKEALAALKEASEAMKKWGIEAANFEKEMEALGFRSTIKGHTNAPFDLISDMFRGMRGSMLDMYRNPDKLLEACEWLVPRSVERGVKSAKASGGTRVFIALHRGAEGFMSLKQFETFYWPTLKKVMLALIDAGLTPAPFFEGDYTSRLEYLLDLPRGKVLGHFDTTDIFKAKEVLKGHMCIRGNFPVSLLQTGSPEEIKEHTRKLINVVGKDGGYIMATRGSLDEADPALVRIWMDYAREYGVYH
jgi:uroporphyrinogen-III decarboxylase